MSSDTELLEQFVRCFTRFTNVEVMQVSTDSSLLGAVYHRTHVKFPALFEKLLTTYRWSEVRLPRLVLFANPPGHDFDEFAGELFWDDKLVHVVLPHGFIPFGRAADGAVYDPVCFDTRHAQQDGDCPIIRLNHEAALVRRQVRQTGHLADSFRELMHLTIEDVRRKGG